ncbi:MAG: NifU family protein [Nitrospirae bacterium]|nr:NifU family protein [Candidatus Troglogloeales bacterium]
MIEITEIAKKKVMTLMRDQEEQGNMMAGIRLTYSGILPTIEYRLAFVEGGKAEAGDATVTANGIKVFMEERNAGFLADVQIDFIESLQQTGFKVNNPKVIMPTPAVPTASPSLDTPQAIAIKKVLDSEINPAISAHGGYITLLDVKEQIAYIQMSGGCQGCGMADVTLKQGVVVAIKKSVPEIVDVLDTTDHGSGNNPYFTPGK